MSKFAEKRRQMLADPAVQAAYLDSRKLNAVKDELVACRNAQGMSQRQLAKKLGVSPSVVQEFEANAGGDPHVKTLMRYARALGLELDLKVTSSTARAVNLARISEQLHGSAFRTLHIAPSPRVRWSSVPQSVQLQREEVTS